MWTQGNPLGQLNKSIQTEHKANIRISNEKRSLIAHKHYDIILSQDNVPWEDIGDNSCNVMMGAVDVYHAPNLLKLGFDWVRIRITSS